MKLTRIAALMLAICCLTGCKQATEAPSQPESVMGPVYEYTFTRETFPKMDGSTATVPFGEAVASVLLSETRDEVSDLVEFNRTTQSYRNLMNGEADILIAAEPAETIWTEKEENGFEWEMEPFAIDGLVFIVNEANPVDSLTTEEIRGIYAGYITNWSQVGGDDLEIMPFQRNVEAGSQAAMEKLVMQDIKMMSPPTEEYYYESMMGLIEGIAAYDNSPAAIGYTMYYYAEDMKMADGLKILSVDDIEPNDDTIRRGEYPFLNNYYVVTAAGRKDTDPVKRLYDWILSEEGQKLAAHEGYVPVMDVGGAETEKTETTESNITENETLLYFGQQSFDSYDPDYVPTYYEPQSKDGLLQTRDDYGALMPYVGGIYEQDYWESTKYLYGLITSDGKIVTEPKYFDIKYLGNFLVLQQMEMEGEGWDRNYENHYTIAAADGSWVKEAAPNYSDDLDEYPYCLINDDLLVYINDDLSIIALNSSGEVVSRFSSSVITNHFEKDLGLWAFYRTVINDEVLEISYYNGLSDYDDLYLDVKNGKVLDEAPEWSYSNGKSTTVVYPNLVGYYAFMPEPDKFADEYYITGEHRINDYNSTYDLMDKEGNIILKDYLYGMVANGWVGAIRDGHFCYFSIDTEEMMFQYPISE